MKRTAFKPNPEKIKAWNEQSRKPLKRTPIQRQKEVVSKRVKIKAVSKKMRVKRREYSALRLEFLEANPFCVPCHDGGKTTEANEVHHMAGRDGDRLCGVTNFLAICTNCHQWVTANPIEAMVKGYSLSRHRTA